MSEIEITPMGPREYGVQIRQGELTTSHRVRVPAGLVDDLQLGRIDEDRLVRESVAFLLERESPTAILREFSLDDIGRYFPEYREELVRRVS